MMSVMTVVMVMILMKEVHNGVCNGMQNAIDDVDHEREQEAYDCINGKQGD